MPYGGVVQGTDGDFYGTTSQGGARNFGTVFKMNANGAVTTLVSFNGTSVSDGAVSYSGLVQGSDGNFYGTTYWGGDKNVSGGSGFGTVFTLTASGAKTNLVIFEGPNGAHPFGGLIQGSDGNFYGTTVYGGTSWTGDNYSGSGTVFQVRTNGVLTRLVSFGGTNGANPSGGLALGNDGNFYGTTDWGGSTANGTVFRVTTNGVLTTLFSFNGANGRQPWGLTLGSDGNLYGTTEAGGGNDIGTVFLITTNGTLSTLASFVVNRAPAGLTKGSDGNFYGMAGGPGAGTVFRVTTNGVLTTLSSFNGWNGRYPGGLTLGNDGNLYGTTAYGGTSWTGDYNYGAGTVFRVTTNGVLATLSSFNSGNGANPSANLTLGNDGNLYGTTSEYATGGGGSMFRVTTNGTLTDLYEFSPDFDMYTNPLSVLPSSLAQGSDGNFYGTTSGEGYDVSGNPDYGTVFQVTPDGWLTTLASFDGVNAASPLGGLTLGNDGKFYGTTGAGGAYMNQFGGLGTVFQVTTNGVLTTLASFNGTNGDYPETGLTLGSDGNFYGTTTDGYSGGNGTVFQVTTNGVLTTLISFARTNGAWPTRLAPGNDGDFYGTTYGGGAGGGGVIYRLRHGVSIQSFGMRTNGFQLSTLNVGGSGWVVLESSSDLMNWMPIRTNGTAAAQQFLDPTALARPQQFYRVRQR